MQNNNVAPEKVAALNFSVWPPSIPPQADYTKVEYPALGALYFCASDQDYGAQTFFIGDANDGSGSHVQCGTFTRPVNNFGVIGQQITDEVFSVYDGAGNPLLATTGDGLTKVNRLSRIDVGQPTVAVKAAAGTGATAVVTRGNDSCFQVQFKPGTSAAIGVQFTVTFNKPFPKLPVVMWATEEADNTTVSWMIHGVIHNVAVNSFDFYLLVAPGSSPAGQRLSFVVMG